MFLGWLVPGWGHWRIGEKRRGITSGVVILAAFILGAVLSNREASSKELHPYSFYAQAMVGGGALSVLYVAPPDLSKVILSPAAAIDKPQPVPRFNDAGILFCNIAGLLNLLLLLDLVDRMVEPKPKARPKEQLA